MIRSNVKLPKVLPAQGETGSNQFDSKTNPVTHATARVKAQKKPDWWIQENKHLKAHGHAGR